MSAAARKFIKDNGVKFILAQFVDIHGSAKAKAVPAAHLDMVLTDGAGFAGFALWGFGMGPHGPDYMAVGDPSTMTNIPWIPGYARMVCDGHVHGKRYPYCSRVVLKKALEDLKKQGLTLYTGIEPEFMLLARRADGTLGPCDPTDDLEKPCYDYKGLARSSGFLGRVVEALRSVGIDVYQIDHEDANGQFEVNYTYSDALSTADRFIFVKMAISEIARAHGFTATFMPKPFSNRTGSGAHFHISLGNAKNRNLFYDERDKNGLKLSQMGYWFVGGLQAHARALTAVCAPTINSYKRLVVGRALSGATWAPAYIAYGDNNRTAFVRIPGGRIELRLPDASVNPYLASAAILAAGMDGVKRKLDPGKPNNTNLYEYSLEEIASKGIKLLPQSLKEAIDALEQDKVICGALGSDLSKEFIELKRMEWVEYSRHVSDWEQKRYLEFF
ncbi:MAG: type III glutamate--ammonia ligase [Alphaproteobacteria bacterium]|nr:type III glutamate--ammonia ligase [Alphaproteobacteria bacterium]